MLGLAQVEWCFEPAASFAGNAASVAAKRRSKPPWGRVLYKLILCSALSVPVVVPVEGINAIEAVMDIEAACEDMTLRQGGGRVKDLTSAPGANYGTILEVAPHFVEQACDHGCPKLVRTVALGQRLESGFLVEQQPPARLVAQWRAECGAMNRRRGVAKAATEQEIYEAVLLELPAHARTEAVEDTSRRAGPEKLRRRQKDPIKIIDALDFASLLRQTEFLFRRDECESEVRSPGE